VAGLLRSLASRMGYVVWHRPARPRAGSIPDAAYYAPFFSPWLGYGDFGALVDEVTPYTINSPDRLYVLHALARQALANGGEFWECGVYRGGSARMLRRTIESVADPAKRPVLRLFDSFEGMKETDGTRDLHRPGDFADTGADAVRRVVGDPPAVTLHPGWIPETFRGLESARIGFVHVDVDLYRSVLDVCEFVRPRMVPGSFMVFDDYGFPSCPGARQAVDEYFAGRTERPLALSTGQAIVFVP
jgi:O-methyltransferase